MQANRILKKASILTIGYIFIFFGIFIVQFKNGSTVTERFGPMKAVFSVQIGQDGRQIFQNRLGVSFGALSLFADERNQIYATAGSTVSALAFQDWERLGENSFRMFFSEGVRLDFSVVEGEEKGSLRIVSSLPESVSEVSIPYSFSEGLSREKQGASSLAVSGKTDTWIFSAHEIGDAVFSLSRESDMATYRFAPPHETFAFSDIPDVEAATAAAYTASLASYKSALISAYRIAFRANAASFSEEEVVSFVAAMAENGSYNEALDLVPQAFKNSAARTYFSAPYFNSLVRANETLTAELNSLAALVRSKSASEPLEVLSHPRLEGYSVIYQKSEALLSLLQSAASEIEARQASGTLTLQDAITALRFYNFLALERLDLASTLKGTADTCVLHIESLAAMDSESLVISEGGSLISALAAAQIGDAFVQYGKLTGNTSLSRAGYLLLNTLFANVSSFDRETLSALYPVVVHGNAVYPHVVRLSDTAWVWTCARNAVYNRDAEGTITLSFNFPVNSTHHVIARGISAFDQIVIYEMAYRSDPHFETYNASGYAYQEGTRSLLIKSRHRSQVENILLRYNRANGTPPQAAPAGEPANGGE